MIDLGKKIEQGKCCSPVEDKSDKKYYPNLYLNGKNFDIPKKLFNKDIEVKCIVRVKRQTQEKNDKGELSGSLDLEVRKIDFGSHSQEKSIGEAIVEAMDEEK